MLATCSITAAACTTRDASPDRVVLIVVDTLRRDHVSAYRDGAGTPNIARLADSGTVFRNARSSFHQTTMSMGAMFTGRTPSIESGDPRKHVEWIAPNWCGLARLSPAPDEGCVPGNLKTIGEVMREGGYWTAAVVSNPLLFRPAGFDQGFEEWVEVGGAPRGPGKLNRALVAEARAGDRVNRAVRDVLAARPGDRFFLYVHYMDVHDWPALMPGWKDQAGVYRSTVEAQDALIGELLDALSRLDLLEGTALVFVSDHGEMLGESHLLGTTPAHFGNPSFEQVLAVPLIVAGADVEDDGRLIRSEDVYRLLARVAGLPHTEAVDLEPDELIVTEQAYQTYRHGRWKSFVRRGDGSHYLVDLETDPGETEDVAARHPEIRERHAERVAELTERLAAPEAPTRALTKREEETLRALGYLD